MAIAGFLDDYTHLIWGLLEVYRANHDRKYLDRATELTGTVLDHFSDTKGGFFQTEDASEEMIVRLKEVYDGAMPSGNSVMAMNLLTLGTLTGESRYSGMAERVFEAFAVDIDENPAAYAHLLSAIAKSRGPSRLLAIIGKGEEKALEFMAIAEAHHDPDMEVVRYDGAQDLPEKLRDDILPRASTSGTIAFLCSGAVCEGPIDAPDDLRHILATTHKEQ